MSRFRPTTHRMTRDDFADTYPTPYGAMCVCGARESEHGASCCYGSGREHIDGRDRCPCGGFEAAG